MKLLFCGKCHDVRKLGTPNKATIPTSVCWCGATWGHYTNDIDAEWGSTHPHSLLLGINNASLARAQRDQLIEGDMPSEPHPLSGRAWVPGRKVDAFIIPASADSVQRKEKP